MSREPVHDLAHIAHAELLTPLPEESLRFFVDLFGMEIEHREGQSVFLRGWGEYQPYGLKLTEARLPGLGHMALRAWSPEALQRRVGAIDATGLGVGWNDGDHAHGPAYEFGDPDGHRFEVFFEQGAIELTTDFIVGADEDSFLVQRPDSPAERPNLDHMRNTS